MSVPDYPLEETLDFKFTTRAFATGIPTTLAGTPAVQVYEDNSVTQITAGITLSVDFDSVTGLNNLRIVATAANGYESGKIYAAVISTGTVGGVSVVGEVVAQFSIERSPALRPTTAGRTLNVAADGDIGGNVDGSVASVAGAVGSVTGSVGSVTAGVTVSTNNDKTGYSISGTKTTLDALNDLNATGVENAVWDAQTGSHIQAATFGERSNDMETKLNTLASDWADGGRLDLILDAKALESTLATAQVDLNTLTDARGEPAQGAPPVSTTTNDKVDYLYKAWRNRSTQNATTYSLYADDATTVDHKATISDNGTTADKGEVAAGP